MHRKGGILGSAVVVRAFYTSVRFEIPLVVEVPSKWGCCASWWLEEGARWLRECIVKHGAVVKVGVRRT